MTSLVKIVEAVLDQIHALATVVGQAVHVRLVSIYILEIPEDILFISEKIRLVERIK